MQGYWREKSKRDRVGMSWGKISRSKADALFSEYIRKKNKGYCEYCKRYFGWKELENSHFFGRRYRSVRFDELNCSSLCCGCHRKLGENPLMHSEWMVDKLGKMKIDALTIKANQGSPIKNRDEGLIVIWCQQKLKELTSPTSE